ncbi:MAG: cupin domain-containing protein [Thainema sp.]
MPNLFDLPANLPPDEYFEVLAASSHCRIERIISTGHTTPPGEWYDQAQDEWVVLLQGEAELAYENGERVHLKAGDYLFIPAHQRHRVESTTTNPHCIWLAIHGNLS